MRKIYLEPSQVPPHLRSVDGYRGQRFAAIVCEDMIVPMDAGLWSGGSRDLYHAIDFYSGAIAIFPGQSSAPWNRKKPLTIRMEPGIVVVRHTISAGKDMGLTFYVHPVNAKKLLPQPSTLTEHEKIVLRATAMYKSSYGGKDRYTMTKEAGSYSLNPPPFPSRDEWNHAKDSLIKRGFLSKVGAITVAGRNAL